MTIYSLDVLLSLFETSLLFQLLLPNMHTDFSRGRWFGILVWYSHLLQNFPQFIVIHTVKDFGIVNKTEIDVFWNSLAFLMIQQILAIWPLVLLPFLKPAWASGSSWFTYCWSLAWRILSITLLVCEMSAVVWSSLSILWDCLSLGLEWKLTFSSPVATAEFSRFADILTEALSQHHLLAFEIA